MTPARLRGCLAVCPHHPAEKTPIGEPSIPATIVPLALGLERIDDLTLQQFPGPPQVIEQSIAFGIDIRIDMVGDLPSGAAEPDASIEGYRSEP